MGNARLSSRPRPPSPSSSPGMEPGVHKVGIRNGKSSRSGAVLVPRGCKTPAPLMLLLHGAGATSSVISLVSKQAEEQGVVVLAPESEGSTWDMIRGSDFGPDVRHIDKTLSYVFDRIAIDPRRIAAAGFSDGASYALSIGVGNGDLFSSILAFSPGFMRTPAERVGSPRIYISHGTLDNVLSIDRCSRRLVPGLQRQGYDVVYTEFEGGHTVPARAVEEGLAILLKP